MLEPLGQYDEADEQFNLSIEKLPADQYSITRLANALITLTKYNYAIATYEHGAALLRNLRIFAYNLGDLYRQMGKSQPMVTAYLNVIEDNPERIPQLQAILQRYLTDEDYR